jgi:hypothetical protein
MDTYMWEKGMTSLKLMTFNQLYADALLDGVAKPVRRHYKSSFRKYIQGTDKYNAQAHASYTKKLAEAQRMAELEGVDPNKLAQDVARHVNDAFGGLNWQKLARDMVESWESIGADKVANVPAYMFSPNGRKINQMAMFAPDWTLANIRIVSRFLPGFESNPKVQNMYAYYALRAGAYTALYANAANFLFTGHLMKDNEEGHRNQVNLGGNKYIDIVKQYMEAHEWMKHPFYSMQNKAGSLFKLIESLKENRKFKTKGGHEIPITDDDDDFISQALKIGGFTAASVLFPISLNQWLELLDEEGFTAAMLAFYAGQQGKILRIDQREKDGDDFTFDPDYWDDNNDLFETETDFEEF